MIDERIDEAIAERKVARESDDVASLDAYKRRFYVLDLLLDSFQNDGIKVRWAVLELLSAGIDTTASLMVHVVYHLGRHPDVCKKVTDEIDTKLEGEKPKADDLQSVNKLKVLDAVIKESTFIQMPSSA